MTSFQRSLLGVGLLVAITAVGCTSSPDSQPVSSPVSSNSPTQEERATPAAGKGNVQGQVFYNSQPAANIEVQLCETFSQFVGGCSGKSYTATTDQEGYYVITEVDPGTYESLLARVFDTDTYIFATTGIAGLDVVEYEVTADQTSFVDSINLFKSDLKHLSPAAGSQVNGQNLTLSWEAYPDAAYYKFSLYPEDASTTSPYIDERVDATSFTATEPVPAGTYRWVIEAYNDKDQKLAENSSDVKFTVN